MIIEGIFLRESLFVATLVIAASCYDFFWFRYIYGSRHVKRSFFLLAFLVNSILAALCVFGETQGFKANAFMWGIMLIKFFFYIKKITDASKSNQNNINQSPDIFFLPILYPFLATMITAFILSKLFLF